LEAEASLLGALLIDKEAIVKVNDLIESQDFYAAAHQRIYENILELFETHTPIDLVTLSDRLEAKGVLNEIGGSSYLLSLANAVPTAAHVVDYAKIVRHKSTLRKLMSAASEISELSFREDEEIEKILDEAERKIFSISQKFVRGTFVPIKDVLAISFERLDEIHKNKGMLRGVATGFTDLDNLTAGLQASDLIILAARPSMGKTSLALNIALNAAKSGVPVGIFSLEMSKEQLVDRLLVAEANIDSWKLRTGNLAEEDFPKIGHAMSTLAEVPLYIDDSPLVSVMEIRTKARRLQAEHGLGLVIVDYLQLMEGKNVENRVQEISEISRSLKALARELSVPVMALSQLSRAVEARTPHIPQLSDLRESGSIEQDADVVMFIYREDYYVKDTPRKNIADILVRKHRNGPTGDIELFFSPEKMRFDNLERNRELINIVAE
jgi:replicative DNA helicase